MQTNYMTREMHDRLWALLSSDEDRRRKGRVMAEDSASASERISFGGGADGLSDRNDIDDERLSLCELVVAVPPGFALPKDRTITISVIGGPSKGLIRRLVKPHVSIGRSGGGADLELDDPQLSDMHCALGVKDHIIRLCDLDSGAGTFVENLRVSVASLQHLSEFRVGRSVLLVTVLPARPELDEFSREKNNEHPRHPSAAARAFPAED